MLNRVVTRTVRYEHTIIPRTKFGAAIRLNNDGGTAWRKYSPPPPFPKRWRSAKNRFLMFYDYQTYPIPVKCNECKTNASNSHFINSVKLVPNPHDLGSLAYRDRWTDKHEHKIVGVHSFTYGLLKTILWCFTLQEVYYILRNLSSVPANFHETEHIILGLFLNVLFSTYVVLTCSRSRLGFPKNRGHVTHRLPIFDEATRSLNSGF